MRFINENIRHMSNQNDISLRLDYARGRDGSEVYVSIGEAF